jgi:glycosyltransferase involved in cell wall biosynthesis
MGILVTPNSAADMQIALEALLADKTGLREQMGRSARLAALEHFDVRDTVNRMGNIFSALI